MKRYKLIKDLPTFKAGNIFYTSEHGDLFYDDSNNGIKAYSHKTLEKFPNILTDWFEEITDSIYWDIKYGEYYWYIDDFGVIKRDRWANYTSDGYRYETGNVYKTEQEAKKARELQIARAKIRRSSNFVPNWDNKHQEKFFVYINHFAKYLDIGNTTSYDTSGQIVFYQTRKEAERAMEELKQEYYLHFGIEKGEYL